MGTILRLQGLDTKASTEDIRNFFEGIQIPDGGVVIVGGAFGEAFIAFNSEGDELLAMQRSGLFLKSSKVNLHISNMAELEHKLATLYKKMPSSTPCTNKRPPSSSNEDTVPVKVRLVDPRIANRPPTTKHPHPGNAEDAASLDSEPACLFGANTLLQCVPSSQTKMEAPEFPMAEQSPPEPSPKPSPGYVRVFGLPTSTSKTDICQLFSGLKVQEVIVNVNLGVSYGCLVKFDSLQDSHDALSFNQCLRGSACVEIRAATEKMWLSALQECDAYNKAVTLKQSPLKDTVNYKQEVPVRSKRKELPHKSLELKTKCQTTTALSKEVQYIVMVSNLPVHITKTEIKELFGCPNIAHRNVLHLLDNRGNRTDTAFVMFNTLGDYEYAVHLSGCHVGSNAIQVSSVTKEQMKSIMLKTKLKPEGVSKRIRSRNNVEVKSNINEERRIHKLDTTTRTCLYVRNMPASVRKSQIKAFFSENKLREADITLLCNCDGRRIGEAVVQFQSQKTAALALMHHGKDFLGTKVLLTQINVKQMEDILANNS